MLIKALFMIIEAQSFSSSISDPEWDLEVWLSPWLLFSLSLEELLRMRLHSINDLFELMSTELTLIELDIIFSRELELLNFIKFIFLCCLIHFVLFYSFWSISKISWMWCWIARVGFLMSWITMSMKILLFFNLPWIFIIWSCKISWTAMSSFSISWLSWTKD